MPALRRSLADVGAYFLASLNAGYWMNRMARAKPSSPITTSAVINSPARATFIGSPTAISAVRAIFTRTTCPLSGAAESAVKVNGKKSVATSVALLSRR